MVVAIVPFWIEPDRLRPHVEPADQIRLRGGVGDNDDDALDIVRIALRPFIGLQPAHRCADHCFELGDPEALDQRLLDPDEIFDADHGKAHAIGLSGIRIDTRRSSGHDIGHIDVEIDQRVRRKHEVFVGIDGLARTNDRVPIAGGFVVARIFAKGVAVAGKEVRDQDRIRFIGIERACRLPADLDRFDRLAGSGGVARQREGLLLDDQIVGASRRAK